MTPIPAGIALASISAQSLVGRSSIRGGVMDRKPHPSGRPIHRRRVASYSRCNIPQEGPLTPRLQASEKTYAIGFTANVGVEEEDEE
jgi:hypothetical protein